MAKQGQHVLEEVPEPVREAIQTAVQEIVSLAAPERVVLFGSYASGEADQDSDIDLLVVARTNNRWRLAAKLYLAWHDMRRRLPMLPTADIIVLTPRQFDKAASTVGFIPYEAVHTGVILYERPGERSEVAG